MHLYAFPLLIVSIALASCGGGGGGGNAGSGSSNDASLLGRRAMPGATVSVSRLAAGTFGVVVDTDEHVAVVNVFVGDSWDSVVPTTVSDLGMNSWRAAIDLPNPAPTSVLVRITLDSGAILETSPEDALLR